jgi:DNA gyrase/topoisomerase IV subunit B
MKYTCDRCSYETNYVTNFKKHLNRREVCEDINDSNKTREQILESLIKDRSSFKHVCQFCSKRFETRQAVHQHKQTCKKKEVAQIEKEIQSLKDKLAIYESSV